MAAVSVKKVYWFYMQNNSSARASHFLVAELPRAKRAWRSPIAKINIGNLWKQENSIMT